MRRISRCCFFLGVMVALSGCEAPGLVGLSTTPSDMSAVPVTSAFALDPVIREVSPPSGKVGQVVTVKGDFFKSSPNVSVFVTFNGYDAEDIQLLDNHTLRARIPSSGSTGFLVVSLGAYRGEGLWYVVHEASGQDPQAEGRNR